MAKFTKKDLNKRIGEIHGKAIELLKYYAINNDNKGFVVVIKTKEIDPERERSTKPFFNKVGNGFKKLSFVSHYDFSLKNGYIKIFFQPIAIKKTVTLDELNCINEVDRIKKSKKANQ